MSLRRAFRLPVGLLLLFAALYAQRRRGGGSVKTETGPSSLPGDVKIYTNESLYDLKVLRTLFIDYEDLAEMADCLP